jgi:hypothetical protein
MTYIGLGGLAIQVTATEISYSHAHICLHHARGFRPEAPRGAILSISPVSYICKDEIDIPGKLVVPFDHPAVPAVGRGCRDLDRPIPV